MNNFAINSFQNLTKCCFSAIPLIQVKRQLLLFLTFLFLSLTYAFAQQPAANLDQLRNGSAASPVDPGNWVNGNLGAQNSHYSEGMSSAYRAIMTNMPASTVVTLTLEYDVKHSDRHALDYLTSYDRVQPHLLAYGHAQEDIDPTIGTPFTEGVGFSTFPIPLFPDYATSPVPNQPEDSFNDLGAADKMLTMWNGTITNITYGPLADLSQSNAPQQMIVTFTTGTSGTVLLAWGGHIASRHDWGSDGGGVPLSAGGISGSPYHMRLIDWNLNNLGNQDRSLSADAIAAPPTCEMEGNDPVCPDTENIYSITPEGATNPTYTWELVGNTSGAFFVGGVPANSATDATVNSGPNGGTFTVKVTIDSDNGTAFCDSVVTVNDLPEMSCPENSSICIDGGAFALSGATPEGGTYSGTGVNAGSFDPAVAGVGTHTITYTYTNGDQCTNSCTFEITVDDLPEMSCPENSSICIDGGAFALSGATPEGGTYSGTGVNAGSFDPAVAGVGTHTITYTYTNGDQCTNSCTFDITVDDLPEMSCPENSSICIDGGAFALSGATPEGGTYSGTGVNAGSFDPAVAGVGTHTITYTYTNGDQCTNSCTFDITVDDLPEMSCPENSSICIDGGAFALSGATPEGGTYSGTGVNAGSFDPAVAGVGTHTITYTYTNGDQCTNSCTFDITVDDLPEMSCPENSSICIDGGAFALSGATPEGGTYSGTGVNAGSFDPAVAGVGTHTITYTYTDDNQCTNSCTFDITVDDLPEMSCPENSSICIDGGAFALSGATPEGGTYSGTGVNAGSFDPAVAGVGTHTITYTYTDDNQCTNSCTFDITVDDLPEMSCPENSSICIDGGAFALSGATPEGGTYSGTGVNAGSFDPAVAGVGTHTITYTYTDDNQCTNSCTFDITVDDLPEMSCPENSSICIDGGAFALSGATPEGGTYSGTGVNAGSFDPAVAGVGTHTITYTYTNGDQCTNSCTFDITVDDLPEMSCPENSSICIDGGAFALSGATPEGGTYSGTGVNAGSFDPAVAGVGTHTITYTYTDDNQCTNSCTFDITVDDLPEMSCPENSSICIDGGAFALSGATPEGGTYSGTGVNAGSFDPAVAGVGTHTITYTYTDDNQCTNSCTFDITVDDLPEMSCPENSSICIDGGAFALSGATPEGGTYSGTGVNAGSFDPAVAGVGTHTITYTYTNGDQCTNSCTFDITVDDLPEMSCPENSSICIDGGAFALSGATPEGGTYSGTGVNAGSFDPAVAGVGTHTITYTYTDDNQCTNSCTFEITVDDLPEMSCPENSSICIDGGAFALSGATPEGGTYSGTGVNAGSFDPAVAGVGTHTITYTYTDDNQCTNSCTFDITVDDLPEMSCPENSSICIDGGAFALSGATPEGGTYSGTGVNAGSFDPAVAGVGTHTITYTYTNGDQCTNSCTFDITVNDLPVVTCPQDSAVCIDADAYALSGAAPAGGTYSGTGVNAGSFDPSVAGIGTHTITYTYTDDKSCTNSCTFDIIVEALPTIEAADPICGELSGFGFYSVDVTTSEGIVTSNFGTVVNINEVSWTITGIPNGQNVIVTTTTTLGCETSIEIEAPDCICIELEYDYTDVTCNGEEDGTITVNFVTEGASVTINGNPYQEDALYPAGIYTISAFFDGVDLDECIITEQFEMTEPEIVSMTVTSTNISCDGVDDGTITVSNLSEGATYTIQLNGYGADLSGQSTFEPGTYLVVAFVDTSGSRLSNVEGVKDASRYEDPCEEAVLVTIEEFECDIIRGYSGKIPDCKPNKFNYLQVNTTGGSGELTYAWSIDSQSLNYGWEILGAADEHRASFKPGFEAAVFTVIVTDEEGCVTECSIKVHSNCANPNELRNVVKFDFDMHPNPTRGKLNVLFDETVNSTMSVEVYNLIGTQMHSRHYKYFKGSNLVIDFSGFPSQVYYLRITTDKGTQIKKVILDK